MPSGPVLDDLEILEDPQMVDREFYQSLDHEEVGTLQYHGPGWLMSKTPNRLREAAHSWVSTTPTSTRKYWASLTRSTPGWRRRDTLAWT